MSDQKPISETKVIVGMSGGVDSSVTALLLQKAGYSVEGLFMKNWDEDDGTEYCTAMQDLADAQAVCDKLGIHLHTANFAAEYWDNVFEHFIEEYKACRTPNPDILCNREIKFKAFLDWALELGADKIATGHYARTGIDEEGLTTLHKGLDGNKDQSYFLHAVGHRQLKQTLFPLGGLEKSEVRRIASEFDLATKAKKDSTGICFIGERRFKDFLEQYVPANPGDIVDTEGNLLGRHSGLMFHTLGQRQGLGIGGVAGAGDDPWYVVDKDVANNTLIVGQGNNHPRLFSKSLYASEIHWVAEKPPTLPLQCTAKTRYRQPDQCCVIHREGNGYRVVFDEPQRAVTPGQSVVFYVGDVCLGGGVIETTEDNQ